MKVSILTSDFPDGFTADFVECFKEHYYCEGSFVFIASDFSGHSKTDEYLEAFLRMFRDNGIIFSQVYVIDDRITKERSAHYIEEADVVWIAGGDTLKQIGSLKSYNLISTLQSRKGITIGMSAGSINMAKKVVLAKNIEENIPELITYDGIGLVDINVEPHFNSISEEHMKYIYEASHDSLIYGIYDNAFIKIVDEKIEVCGEFIKFEKGRIS